MLLQLEPLQENNIKKLENGPQNLLLDLITDDLRMGKLISSGLFLVFQSKSNRLNASTRFIVAGGKFCITLFVSARTMRDNQYINHLSCVILLV